jgi:flagellar biosynthesis/type III secretory pathway protein FliH
VVVALNPVDHATLIVDEGPVRSVRGRVVRLVADASLRPGDAVATTGATRIESVVANGVERVRSALGLDR